MTRLKEDGTVELPVVCLADRVAQRVAVVVELGDDCAVLLAVLCSDRKKHVRFVAVATEVVGEAFWPSSTLLCLLDSVRLSTEGRVSLHIEDRVISLMEGRVILHMEGMVSLSRVILHMQGRVFLPIEGRVSPSTTGR